MNLLRVVDLDTQQLRDVLDCAAAMKGDPSEWHGRLERKMLVGLFALPSTRTRLAFAAAAHRLGVLPFFVETDSLHSRRGEVSGDTARSLSAVADLLVARLRSHAELAELAGETSVPVINALSDRHHPCEAITSLFTLAEHFGGLDGLQLAYVGDGNNVSHSLLEAAAVAGLQIRLACPDGFRPDPTVVSDAERVAAATGGEVLVGDDPHLAVDGGHAVFTDRWVSMGDEAEAALRRRTFEPYRVDNALLARAASDAVFIHCLPARRGEEVTAEVLDGPRSLVWQQVANHVFVAQALIWKVLSRG